MSATEHTNAGHCDNEQPERIRIIRDLNDALRRRLPSKLRGCRIHVTDGVASLGAEKVALLLLAVKRYDDFKYENDPHGEHDFGAFEHEHDRFFWKIDCYDQWVRFGSPDPTDPSVTTRVLTVMRADEY